MNLTIGRVIAHEVVRASQLEDAPPVMSNRLIEIDDHGRRLVAKRIVEALGSGSHCIEVTPDECGTQSPFDKLTAMLDSEDDGFIRLSSELALSLSSAQTSGQIRSGSVIFVQGTCNFDDLSCRYIVVIKADSDQGLAKRIGGDSITLTFVADMVLSESQRLLKVGFFLETQPSPQVTNGVRRITDFSIRVFDQLLQNSGDRNAALYFYKTFLRCSLTESAPRQTRVFFQTSCAFLDSLDIPGPEKVELKADVISYLRSNRETIEPRSFAREVLPAEHQDRFLQACQQAGIDNAFAKNTDLIKTRLRRQTVKFSSQVTIQAPADLFRESVRIGETDKEGWTDVKIHGTVAQMP